MNHFDLVIKEIRLREDSHDLKAGASYATLRHLIELMGEEKFNLKFKHYFIDFKLKTSALVFEASFYHFHRAMRQTDFFGIGDGHLDMIFWYYIHLSDKCFNVLKAHYDFFMAKYDEYMEEMKNVGKRVEKDSNKPFKSGCKINTVKNVIIHPKLEIFAYTFEEDDSYVECRRCKILN